MDLTKKYAPARERGSFRISANQRDHYLVTLWLVITFRQWPYDELILYPLAFYYAWAFVRDFSAIFPLLMRSLILFCFPVWCMLSVLWGAETALIIKSAAQLFLTVMICYCVALRLTRQQVLQSLLLAAGIYGVASLLLPSTGGIEARGVFTSKNSMGLSMVLLLAVALCVAADNQQKTLLRLVAAVLAAIALRLCFQSQSATAVLLGFGVAGIVLIGVLMRGRGVMHPAVLLGLFAVLGAVLVSLAFALALNDVDLVGVVLDKFGKDATLTGRTVLWGYAIEQIREHPLLGVGAGGFWDPYDWTSVSRRIYIDFHKTYSSRFTFHNSYLQVAVHQGLIGAAIATSAFLWAVYQVFASALRAPTMPRVFFVAIATVMMARNMTEPGLTAPFSLNTMVLYIGALMTLRESTAPQTRHAPAGRFGRRSRRPGRGTLAPAFVARHADRQR